MGGQGNGCSFFTDGIECCCRADLVLGEMKQTLGVGRGGDCGGVWGKRSVVATGR